MMNSSENSVTGNILIVDDTAANLRLLNELLSDAGYDVRPVADGRLALSGAKAIPPDLILLDIKMPGMDGYEVCRQLKADAVTEAIPVIFISALGETEDIVKGFAVGGVDYIHKPFQREEVLSRVKAQLTLRAAITAEQKANARLEAIFASVQDTIITLDDQLRLIHSNKNENTLCATTQEKELACLQAQSKSGLGPCYELVLKTLESQQPIHEFRMECDVCQQGKKSFVVNTAPLNDASSRSTGVVLVIRDESRLVQLEQAFLERQQYANLVGQSKPMQKIYTLLEQMAQMEFNALIVGESGTGKELVAEAIHYSSQRAEKQLVKVNCAALSDTLLGSELFGHVRGAFTGAVADRQGRIQAAESGTLFLDEIGDISMAMQLRLLRFLESKEYDRVGDSKTRHADVRVIAATNSNLQEKMREGTFREDLYYRLMGVVFEIPPLRERMEDLLLICEFFIQRFGQAHQKEISAISEPVKNRLLSHAWPGNVRELKNVIDFACALCPGGPILEEHLPPYFQDAKRVAHSAETISVEGDEKEAIIQALQQVDGNKAKAARLLGISRATIYNKIKVYGITE
jgi:two-component system response regulator HydG